VGSWLLTMTAPGLKDAYKNIRLDRWFSPPPKCYFPDEIQTGHPDLQFRQQEDTLDIKEQPIISPIKTDVDSIGMQYEIDELEVAGIKRGKDLIYNVAQEVEEWLDKGRKYYPDIVHEYLIEKNSGYFCKGLDPDMPMNNDLEYGCLPFFGNYNVSIALRKNILQVEKIAILPWEKKTQVEVNRHGYEVKIYLSVLLYPLKNYRLTIQVMRNARQTLFEGYSKVQKFSSGIYMPGVREHYRTLYWNPSLRSDDEGKASIEFYNTQFGREIEIDACGITSEGDLVCKDCLY
jgi:hypothetical protein